MKIIGRKKEIEELNRIYETDRAEFVALFGRRRVGKTFLVNELFSSRYSFKHTALSIINEDTDEKVTTKDQLNHFYESLRRYGYKGDRNISDWFQAFYALEDLLESKGEGRKVVFIDELPWLDTHGSKFVNALESFWNGWANGKNIMLIVCGSANAWMTKKMLNNYGGLYNRVTKEIELAPFTLGECEEFFKERGIVFSRYDIVQAYMALGGIPYYLERVDGRLSLGQNIDELFFRKNAPFKREFGNLFKSSFKSPELIERIVKILSKKRMGFTREEIVKELGIQEGEVLSNAFNALSSSGLIAKYRPLAKSRKELYYKLTDPFCLFYLHYAEGNLSFDENMFERGYESMKIVAWKGICFENVCFNHIEKIKNALRIAAVNTETYPFVYVDEDGKLASQIDMVVDRADNIVNLCEMKFYSDEYRIEKADYLQLMRKDKALAGFLKKKQIVRNTLITTYGLAKNEYSSSYQYVLTLDDLFN